MRHLWQAGAIPIPVSTAMLAACAARLGEVYPCDPKAQTPLPESLDDYQIITFDGKAIKRVAKRLKALWASPGACWAGGPWSPWTCAAAWPWPCAVIPTATPTRSDSWATWYPGAVAIPGKRLWVADAAFCDLTQPAHFAEQGDAFLVRYHPKVPFYADAARPARWGRIAAVGSTSRSGGSWAARGTRRGCMCGGSPWLGPARRT